ncbi:Splicing factor [Kappamyces sp. JEL0680]|nr:Splicing factor [Kappamyces sp. JEL0680]
MLEYVLDELEGDEVWISKERMRSLCGSALRAVGRHFKDSHLVWNMAKDLELFFLNKHQTNEGIDHVRQLFLQRLAVPHAGTEQRRLHLMLELEETSGAYSAFESTFGSEQYTDRMKNAMAIVSKTRMLCSKREALEMELLQSENSLQVFMAYKDQAIKWASKEKKSSGLDEVVSVYQRAIRVYYWDAELWDSYLIFCLHHSGSLPCITLAELDHAAIRATKSSHACMTKASLWHKVLLIREHLGASIDDIQQVAYEAALFISSSQDMKKLTGFLGHALVSVYRTSKDEETVKECFKTFLEYQSHIPGGDSEFHLHVSMAYLFVQRFNNKQAAYQLFQSLAKQHHEHHLFLEWIHLALSIKDDAAAREVFQLAVRRPMLFAEKIYTLWISFEERYGDLQTVTAALSQIAVCREKDSKNVALQTKLKEHLQATSGPAVHDTEMDPAEEPETRNSGKRERDSETDLDPKKLKREQNKKIGDISTYKVVKDTNAGHMVFLGNLPSTATQDQLYHKVQAYGKVLDVHLYPNAETGVLEALVEFSNVESVIKFVLDGPFQLNEEEVVPQRCRPETEQWNFTYTERKDTIYVSNLPGDCDKILLRQTFGAFGKIRDIRLQLRTKYAFAYIQFESEDAAAKSKALDQKELVPNRKIGVAISNPSKKTVHDIDPKRLFVSNLADSITEPDLSELFAKQIRLVKTETGSTKGIAYVHFETEEAAKKGLQLNGHMLDNRLIIVTIADPNNRRASQKK